MSLHKNQWHRVLSAYRKEEIKIYKLTVVKMLLLFNFLLVALLAALFVMFGA